MQRWNGWGDASRHFPVPEAASAFLSQTVGPGIRAPDVTLDEAVRSVPVSRLSPNTRFSIEPLDRLLHSCGQSLPDWIALRSGTIRLFPDGVAYPGTVEEVRSIIDYAKNAGVILIPYGAGSSVVGHINRVVGDRPVLTVDLRGLNHIVNLDRISRIANVEAGIWGPVLESGLRQHGFTFGHYPQSFEYSSLGGWIATRSSGQQSYYYGRIEDQFLGGEIETPQGKVEISPYPASAAGPDIKHLVLGSEGRLGIITRAAIRIHPIPEAESFQAVFFPDWDIGAEVVRLIVQNRIPVSMLRLSDEIETRTTLLLSGKDRFVPFAERSLDFVGLRNNRCLLIFGSTGSPATVRQAVSRVHGISMRHGGLPIPVMVGRLWEKTRFFTPYLRNSLWECGYALDTLETVLPWEKVVRTARRIRGILQDGLAGEGERVLAFTHLSHVYPTGASFYITYLFRRTPDPEQTLARWKTLKANASRDILTEGGTITHQHGVGIDHAPYLLQERGQLFTQALRSAFLTYDPEGMCNPGKLVIGPVEEIQDVETRLA